MRKSQLPKHKVKHKIDEEDVTSSISPFQSFNVSDVALIESKLAL
jgi:hypothetical protein